MSVVVYNPPLKDKIKIRFLFYISEQEILTAILKSVCLVLTELPNETLHIQLL